LERKEYDEYDPVLRQLQILQPQPTN